MKEKLKMIDRDTLRSRRRLRYIIQRLVSKPTRDQIFVRLENYIKILIRIINYSPA